MKFLILNTDYPEFLRWLYSNRPELETACYAEQLKSRMETLFGVADFYSSNLRKLGHEAWDVHANNEFMQKAWARENCVRFEESLFDRELRDSFGFEEHIKAVASLGYVRRLARPLLRLVNGSRPAWFYDILAAQIKQYRPDVLLNQDLALDIDFLSEMKAHIRLLVGQHAATRLAETKKWNCYDLVISSFPATVDFFRQKNIPSALNRLGFEPAILRSLPPENRNLDLIFVGSFHRVHKSRTELLEALCLQFPQLKIWGPQPDLLSTGSPIRKHYMGQAWGREMYQLLNRAKIVLNHHGDVPPWANNLRLFEATGMGALLLTDWKENLAEMFEPSKEVVAYRTADECIELATYYLEHDQARCVIADAGQQRTFREHSYEQRMREFVDLVGNSL